jgi:sec-independent protein translocase protein TatA
MVGDILQPTHLIFILVVALLVLGPKRLPEVGRSLGKGIRDFKGAMAGIEEHTNLLSPTNLMAPLAAPEAEMSVPAPVTPAVTVPEESPTLSVAAEPGVAHRPTVAATATMATVGTTATQTASFEAPAFEAPSLPPLEEVAQGIGLPADSVSAPRHEPEPSDYSD